MQSPTRSSRSCSAGQWRQCPPTLLKWGEVKLFGAAISAAEKIGDSLQRARAYERLIKRMPPRDAALFCSEPLQEAVRGITDANNRVRALCRLAVLSPPEQRAPIFAEAVNSLGSVKNDRGLPPRR